MLSRSIWLHPFLGGPVCSDIQNGGLIGIALKKKLTTKGLRQAEVEFYLWSNVSHFPFVQIITDMESGGFAYYALPDKAEDGEFLLMLSWSD